MVRSRRPGVDCNRLPQAWIALAVTAFLVSVCYALLLVLARSGMVTLFGDNERGFHSALVLHVNFSLLVWFLSMGGFFWSRNRQWASRRINCVAFAAALAGVLLIAVAPLVGAVTPIMSDYLPVLDQVFFLAGIGLFALAVSVVSLPSLVHLPQALASRADSASLLCGAAALVLLLADVQLGIAASSALPDTALLRYQRLFWGAGHLLQTVNLLLVMQAWLWLLGRSQVIGWPARLFRIQVPLILFPALISPLFPYLPAPYDMRLFTWQMEWNGLLVMPSLLGLLLARSSTGAGSALLFFLRLPIWLLLLGFILGWLIEENNAWVPAHYHGVIGAITLSYMGVCYHHLGILGNTRVAQRLLAWQSGLYGGGILLVMAGLIVSDIPRKNLVAVGDLPPLGRLLMATGGGGALIASLLFVVLMAQHRLCGAGSHNKLADLARGAGDV
ncbi:hypothetical protein [Sedimenticola sp.]|uniref:hypothetical protein n=1 Tax=Sedimenticola sp. TaxID=1940285 RepID=UPI003D14FBF6